MRTFLEHHTTSNNAAEPLASFRTHENTSQHTRTSEDASASSETLIKIHMSGSERIRTPHNDNYASERLRSSNMSHNTSKQAGNFRTPQFHENISEHLKMSKNVSENSGAI